MTSPFNRGPIAPERNPPIQPQYYQPSRFEIENITLGLTTLVTTSVDHNYVLGQVVRTLIPSTYGTRQLNEKQGEVISIPAANQFVLPIDSRAFDPFVSNPAYGPTPPQVLAIGDVNSGIISSAGRSIGSGLTGTPVTIPGAFINISPN